MKFVTGGMAVLFAAIGIGLLIFSYYQIHGTLVFLASAQTATGEVVNLRLSSSTSSMSYHPVVRFTAADGRIRDFVSGAGSNPPSYSVGEEVDVLYSPDHPERARIRSFVSLWMAAIITGGMGAAFFLISTGTFVVRRLRQTQEQNLLHTGERIEARLVQVVRDPRFQVNGIHPFRVEAQWLDQARGQMHVFLSDRIWYDPVELLQPNRPIPVYLDRGNPKKYYVDLSFLPKMT